MTSDRRLVFVRHAKSAYPHGVPDPSRPLSGRGRRNAQAAGRWFVAEGPLLDAALCSPATRARHTWEIVRSVLVTARRDVRTTVVPALYGASTATVLDVVRQVPDDVLGLAVVGHEPTMSSSVLALAGAGSDEAALAAVATKFATNAVAVLRFAGPWRELAPGAARLETFVKPRA